MAHVFNQAVTASTPPINTPTSLHKIPAQKNHQKFNFLSSSGKTVSSQSYRATISKKFRAGSNTQEIEDQLLYEASSELDKAHVICEALVNASEAGLKCAEVVAIFYEKAENQKKWKLLSIDKNGFNRQIQDKDIVVPAIQAFRKPDAR